MALCGRQRSVDAILKSLRGLGIELKSSELYFRQINLALCYRRQHTYTIANSTWRSCRHFKSNVFKTELIEVLTLHAYFSMFRSSGNGTNIRNLGIILGTFLLHPLASLWPSPLVYFGFSKLITFFYFHLMFFSPSFMA